MEERGDKGHIYYIYYRLRKEGEDEDVSLKQLRLQKAIKERGNNSLRFSEVMGGVRLVFSLFSLRC